MGQPPAGPWGQFACAYRRSDISRWRTATRPPSARNARAAGPSSGRLSTFTEPRGAAFLQYARRRLPALIWITDSATGSPHDRRPAVVAERAQRRLQRPHPRQRLVVAPPGSSAPRRERIRCAPRRRPCRPRHRASGSPSGSDVNERTSPADLPRARAPGHCPMTSSCTTPAPLACLVDHGPHQPLADATPPAERRDRCRRSRRGRRAPTFASPTGTPSSRATRDVEIEVVRVDHEAERRSSIERDEALVRRERSARRPARAGCRASSITPSVTTMPSSSGVISEPATETAWSTANRHYGDALHRPEQALAPSVADSGRGSATTRRAPRRSARSRTLPAIAVVAANHHTAAQRRTSPRQAGYNVLMSCGSST